MKIAVLSDVHGNVPALEAVLEDIERWRPERVIINGDLLNRGPESARVLALVDRHLPEADRIRGNHENYLLACAAGKIEGGIAEIDCLAEWSVAQLGDSLQVVEREWRDHLDIERLDNGSSLHVTHGSRLGDRKGIQPDIGDEELAEKLGDPRALFIASHTHKAFTRDFNGTLVVNTGSVGQPFDGDVRAAYARLTFTDRWRVELVRLAYDRARAERDFFDSGFMDGAGPLARLILREWREARVHVGVWRHHYLAAVKAGEIGVAEAVQAYWDTLP